MNTLYQNVGLVVAAMFVLGSSCEPNFPVTDEEKATIRATIPVMMVAAVANNGPTSFAMGTVADGVGGSGSAPAYEGDTSIEASIACLAGLNETGGVQPITGDELVSTCNGDRNARACTGTHYTGSCDGPVWFNEGLMPLDLLELGPALPGGTGRRSVVDLTGTLYHEAIHTEQGDRHAHCEGAVEVEAYDHQERYLRWLQAELLDITDGGGCLSLNEAVANGMDPAVREFVVGAVSGIDPNLDVPEPQCSQIGDLASRASGVADLADLGVRVNRLASASCTAASAAISPLMASSRDFPYYVTVRPGDSTLYLFRNYDTGPVLEHSYLTGLNDRSRSSERYAA